MIFVFGGAVGVPLRICSNVTCEKREWSEDSPGTASHLTSRQRRTVILAHGIPSGPPRPASGWRACAQRWRGWWSLRGPCTFCWQLDPLGCIHARARRAPLLLRTCRLPENQQRPDATYPPSWGTMSGGLAARWPRQSTTDDTDR